MSWDRQSKCQAPQSPPLEWHRWCRPREKSPVTDELLEAFDGLEGARRIERYAAIQQRLRAAAAGELFEEDDSDNGPPLKPVHRDPHLWEIRWCLDGQQWRLYHAEPGEAPGFLIGLRFHRKATDGTEMQIRVWQNSHIDCATRRYDAGRTNMWGLP